MNAEIEHASPYGKDPGEKVPGQKRKIGAAAARAYKERSRIASQHGPKARGAPAASGGFPTLTVVLLPRWESP